MLLTPVIYEKYDKGARLARALKELRVGFILAGTGVSVSLLIAYVAFVYLYRYLFLIYCEDSSLRFLPGLNLDARTLIKTQTLIKATISRKDSTVSATLRKPVPFSSGCFSVISFYLYAASHVLNCYASFLGCHPRPHNHGLEERQKCGRCPPT